MANISGIVVDQTNTGIPNTAVMLSGAILPQVMLTDTQGKFGFSGLVNGAYKLTADQSGAMQTAQQFVQISGGVNSTGILLQLTNLAASSTEDDRYKTLKYIQYIFLMIAGLIYFGFVAFGIQGLTVKKVHFKSANHVFSFCVTKCHRSLLRATRKFSMAWAPGPVQRWPLRFMRAWTTLR